MVEKFGLRFAGESQKMAKDRIRGLEVGKRGSLDCCRTKKKRGTTERLTRLDSKDLNVTNKRKSEDKNGRAVLVVV